MGILYKRKPASAHSSSEEDNNNDGSDMTQTLPEGGITLINGKEDNIMGINVDKLHHKLPPGQCFLFLFLPTLVYFVHVC